MIWQYLLCAVLGYLLGSISTGVLISLHTGRNLREEGSHSTGASNALRVLGVKGGLLTFLGDFFKALIAVVVGMLIAGKHGGMIGALAVVLGHNWPLFFHFKGGKGIACCAAILLVPLLDESFPMEGLAAVVVCLLVIYITRYISVGSLTMLGTFFLLLLFNGHPFWPDLVWAFVLLALAVYRHRENLVRLKNGTENKIGQKV